MTPLRQRMIDDMQLRNLAASTQRQYIAYVAGFAKYFGRSPAELDIEAVRLSTPVEYSPVSAG
jgi:integrase/recombinase XerD